jgi:chromosome segregation ATPase
LVNEAQEQARHSIQEGQEQVRRQAQEAEEKARRALHDVQSRANAAAEQLQDFKAQVSRLQSEKAQAKAQADQHFKKLKEELTASTHRKISELQTTLSSEEEKRTELQIRLAESEGKAEALASQLASLETQLGTARVDQSGARKARDELASVQQRAAELQALLQKERREKDAVEKRASAAEAIKTELQGRIGALESAMARIKAEPERAKVSGSAGQAELIAERDHLKVDLASMKKKLVAAEAAMEAAASLKAKVARLEAQLKVKK